MTYRRNFILGLGVTATTSLAGCTGQIQEVAGSITGRSRTIGDSADYKGVRVTPDKYILADSAKRVYPNNRRQITAPDGATFVFTHIRVSHEGDSAQEFPKSTMQDTIDLYYDGERVSEGMRNDATSAYIVDGKKLTTYHRACRQADATGEVYPGTKVDGWLFHELAANFDPAKVELEVVWNQQVVGDEGEVVHKWMYTQDAEISTEEVEGDEKGDGISI